MAHGMPRYKSGDLGWDSEPRPRPVTAADRPSVTDDARAEAWDEGYREACRDHSTWCRRKDQDHGQRHINPYRAAGRAETTTATTEDAAEALHGDACPEDPDSGETCGCDHDYYRRQANVLAAHGLLATDRTRPTLAEISLRLALEMDCERVYDDNANAYYCNEHDVGWLSDTNQCARAERLADAVLALFEGGGDR